jgi:hypothetical protein
MGAVFFTILVLLTGGNVCSSGDVTNAAARFPETEEALALARRFEIGPSGSWNTNSFRLHFATDAFLSRALTHWLPVRDLPREFRKDFEEVCQRDLLEAWLKADSVRLLRHKPKEDGVHCQYRLIQHSGHLAYWTLLIGRHDGRAGIIDAHDDSNFPWFRHAAEATFLMAICDPASGVKMPSLRGSNLTAKASADLREFLSLTFDGKWSQALPIYSRLPTNVQSAGFIRLTYGACLRAVEHANAKQVFDELMGFHFTNVIEELSALNSAHQQKNLYAFMAAARGIEEKAGPDAYLDVMRAQVQRYHGALADAEADAARAAAAEPSLLDAHVLLIDLALKSGDYATVAQRIRQQEKAFDINLSRLTEQEDFAAFARSVQGRDWLSSHGTNANTHAKKPAPTVQRRAAHLPGYRGFSFQPFVQRP